MKSSDKKVQFGLFNQILGGKFVMRLNPPKKFTFWSSLVIFVLGMIVVFHLVPFIPANYGVIAVFVGYGLLFAGNLLKGF